jgi:hypothetical protein
MDPHVSEWLGVYLDGELRGLRLALVERHLEQCPECQARLQELQLVSHFLQVNLPAPVLTPPERFVAQVNLRLPRRQLQPAWKRTLEAGWRLVPFGLLVAWVFLQAVLLVSGMVTVAFRLGIASEQLAEVFPLAQPSAGLLETLPLTGASLAETFTGILQLLSSGGPFGWGLPVYIILTLVIALLYWGWLASWRLRRRQLLT